MGEGMNYLMGVVAMLVVGCVVVGWVNHAFDRCFCTAKVAEEAKEVGDGAKGKVVIDKYIHANSIMIFSKDVETCPAVKELSSSNIRHCAINADENIIEALAVKTCTKALPSCWLHKRYVGTADKGPGILPILRSGKLKEMMGKEVKLNKYSTKKSDRSKTTPKPSYLNAKKTRDLMHNLRANGTGLTTRDKPADANV